MNFDSEEFDRILSENCAKPNVAIMHPRWYKLILILIKYAAFIGRGRKRKNRNL